jgi:hypothetical protein
LYTNGFASVRVGSGCSSVLALLASSGVSMAACALFVVLLLLLLLPGVLLRRRNCVSRCQR